MSHGSFLLIDDSLLLSITYRGTATAPSPPTVDGYPLQAWGAGAMGPSNLTVKQLLDDKENELAWLHQRLDDDEVHLLL